MQYNLNYLDYSYDDEDDTVFYDTVEATQADAASLHTVPICRPCSTVETSVTPPMCPPKIACVACPDFEVCPEFPGCPQFQVELCPQAPPCPDWDLALAQAKKAARDNCTALLKVEKEHHRTNYSGLLEVNEVNTRLARDFSKAIERFRSAEAERIKTFQQIHVRDLAAMKRYVEHVEGVKMNAVLRERSRDVYNIQLECLNEAHLCKVKTNKLINTINEQSELLSEKINALAIEQDKNHRLRRKLGNLVRFKTSYFPNVRPNKETDQTTTEVSSVASSAEESVTFKGSLLLLLVSLCA